MARERPSRRVSYQGAAHRPSVLEGYMWLPAWTSSRPPSLGSLVAEHRRQWAAIQIQAVWRACSLRRKLHAILGVLYTRLLCNRIMAAMEPRAQAKAYIRARNQRIQSIREEIAKNSGVLAGFTAFMTRQRLLEDLGIHLSNPKHRLRAALIIQAWWRGCRCRGWEGRGGHLHARRGRPRRTLRDEDSDDEHDLQERHDNYSSFLHKTDSRLVDQQEQHGGSTGSQAWPRSSLQSSGHALASALFPEGTFGGLAAMSNSTAQGDPNHHYALSGDWSWSGSLATSLTAPFSYVASALTSDQDGPVYPGTRVKQIGVHQVRSAALGRGPTKKVLILFSDTGGGHRASALALEAALKKQYGDQISVSFTDFMRDVTVWPFTTVPEIYQALGSQFPSVYKKIYEAERGSLNWRDTRTFQMIWYFNREAILAYLTDVMVDGVDLIVSVHPLLNHVVTEGLKEIFENFGDARGVSLPVVTVVTDLGSAHLSWFDPQVDALFVPSREIQRLALHHGVPRRKIHLCGLPVREGFWVPERRPKAAVQAHLGLRPSRRPGTVLLMGGGEGFGNIVQVSIAIGERLAMLGFGQLVVICGRNEEVRLQLEEHPWPKGGHGKAGACPPRILGFIPNVDEYMSAADLIVTKAGPGSIAEAMIKGLPCLLISFLPGQEEGNVAFVTGGGAGEFVPDTEPESVADTVAAWLEDPALLGRMSRNAQQLARPRAALDIAGRMCDGLLDMGVELTEGRPAVARRAGSGDAEDWQAAQSSPAATAPAARTTSEDCRRGGSAFLGSF